MAITFPRAVPLEDFANVQIIVRAVVAEERSIFTLERQVQPHQGGMFRAVVTFAPLTDVNAGKVKAWLASNNSREGTFFLGDPAATVPLGAAAATPGAPVVDGGGQSGFELQIRGAPASTPGWLLEGDYIQLGAGATQRMHMVVAPADTDGAGNVTLDIWPRLRESPADAAAIVLTDPKAVFALDQDFSEWTERPPFIHDIGFTAAEAI